LRITPHIGMFIEMEYNRGTAKVDIANGEATTKLRSIHAIGGLSYSF